MTHQEAIDTGAAERYQLGEMPELERHAFEAHFFECPDCADAVRLGAQLEEAVRTHGASMRAGAVADPGPEGPGLHDPRRAGPSGPAATWAALAAAAVLALVAGYQGFVTIPQLRNAAEPRALAPVILRPLSRGELPVLPAGPDPVTLSLDVNVRPEAGELIYDLGTENGASVLSGAAPLPQPGVPLLLLLPGNTLTTGRYVLTLRAAADRSIEVGSYRFIVR